MTRAPATTIGPSENAERLITAEEFFRMGEAATMGTELVDGKLVGKNMPTGYIHGHIEAMIAAILIAFMRTAKLGKILSGEVGISGRGHVTRRHLERSETKTA